MPEQNSIDHSEMLAVGTTLQGGKYRVERCLASGGFGNTYVVQNTVFGEQMAMKEFFMRGVSERDDNSTVSVSNATNQASFDGQREKFRKEALRLRKLHNEHIVQVHDLFDENGTSYYVMDYIDGESLAQRLERTGKPLSEAEALKLMEQVLDALEVTHAQRIWHLDLKPGNIMVDSNGIVKLIDFGASKQMSANDGYTTTTTALCYTPGYAPLEQIDQKMELIGPWTDLYALGGTLYNLLTRHQPPMGSELHEKDAFVYPEGISQRTRQLISWMMSPHRTARPQSVAEVRAFFAKSKKEENTVFADRRRRKTKPKKQSVVKKITTPLWRKRKLLTRLAFVVVVVGLVIIGVVALTKPNEVTVEMRTDTDGNKVFKIEDVEFTMIAVEDGTFTMGATSEQSSDAYGDEKPTHKVTLSSFYIGQTEVTQALWQAVMGNNPSKFIGANKPVEQVNWDDCQEFIKKLSSLTGQNFKLPTEAQWEYAARGGNRGRGYKYSGGNNAYDVAWYYVNSGNETHDVATKQPNELGIYDMSGNVYEWCSDLYGSYSSDPQADPTGPVAGSGRVYRGGYWNTSTRYCRMSCRDYCRPDHQSSYLGLRLAL